MLGQFHSLLRDSINHFATWGKVRHKQKKKAKSASGSARKRFCPALNRRLGTGRHMSSGTGGGRHNHSKNLGTSSGIRAHHALVKHNSAQQSISMELSVIPCMVIPCMVLVKPLCHRRSGPIYIQGLLHLIETIVKMSTFDSDERGLRNPIMRVASQLGCISIIVFRIQWTLMMMQGSMICFWVFLEGCHGHHRLVQSLSLMFVYRILLAEQLVIR